MKLSLAFSPCPNDTFAFYGLVKGHVKSENLSFEPVLLDIQELNMAASRGEYDICKMSYFNYFQCMEQYVMLRSGSALGFDNGPVLICADREKVMDRGATEVMELKKGLTVALPGRETTAAFLFQSVYGQDFEFRYMLFSEIEGAVARGEVDAGVLIHEGRFVFRERGLELIADLGREWHKNTGLAVPLGGVAVRRSFVESGLALRLQDLLRESICCASKNPSVAEDYIKANAQELSSEIVYKHIQTFVNEYTLDIGEIGEKSVKKMYEECGKLFNFAETDSLQVFV